MSTDITSQQSASPHERPQDDANDPSAPSGRFGRSGDWSRKRAVITGAIVGALFGMIFFAAYGATAAWICSSQFTCGHWAPIAITSGAGAVGFMFFGAIGAYVLHFLYKLFKLT